MKKFITACVIVLLIALISAGAVFRGNYVYIDGKFYKKDVKYLFIDMDKTSVNELNRCSELETLFVQHMDNEALEKMNAFEELQTLVIVFSDSEMRGSGIEKINMLPKLEKLSFYNSEADLSGIANDSLKEMILWECRLADASLKGLNNCNSLEKIAFQNCNINASDLKELEAHSSLCEMDLVNVTMDNCFTVTEDEDFFRGRYALTDSSFLSEFDNITRLSIGKTFIEDISGIKDMASLEELTVTEGFISEAYKKALEYRGINVIES